MSIFRKLGWFFKQEKKHYLLGVGSLVLVALVQLAPPKVIGIIIDEIAEKRSRCRRSFLGHDLDCFSHRSIRVSFCLANAYLGQCRLEKRYADSYLHILQGWISCFIKSIGQVI